MKFSESWLRSFCSPDWTTEQLADRLTMAGLEVEEVTTAAPAFSGVVVAEVRSVTRHPDADKLNVCEVDVGDGTLRSIVCGAPNVAAGLRVPCALPGAVLPGGFEIKPVKMRGVRSEGMLCSARELGMSEDHSGLLVLEASASVGQSLRDALSLDDAVFLLKLTPNLAHCFGVHGIAREVSALSGAPLKAPTFTPVPVTLPASDVLPVKVLAPDLCGRFSGRVLRGVNARAAMPDWMRARLERAGQRSISALVDISNYVMLELGRPSHVFDLAKIHGGLEVRWAREGESLKLLNGQTITLAPDVGIIADTVQVESLAGIMGGDSTAVSLDTTDIYLEAAFWWPESIAGRARRYNFSTDAAQRFERGVDAATTVDHLEYLSKLILEICGGAAGPVDDTVLALPARPDVRMRVARARRIIGVELSEAEMAQSFTRLGFAHRLEEGVFIVTPPSWRFDLQIEEDLIEEVVRLWGFERLPVRPPRARSPMLPQPEGRRTPLALRRTLAARDWQEVITYSFVERSHDFALSAATPIALRNPIAAQMDVMRTTLWGGLLDVLAANLNRKASRVRIFELGRVFSADPGVKPGPFAVNGIAQPRRLSGLAFGPVVEAQWGVASRLVDFFDVKGDLEVLLGDCPVRFEADRHVALHPGRSARVMRIGADGKEALMGWIGALHPALQKQFDLPSAPILFELDLEPLRLREVAHYEEVSKLPPVIRDLAVVLDDAVTAAQVLSEVGVALASQALGGVVKNVGIFDEYRGKGLENKEKSLALRFWMQDTQRTLNDAEVSEIMAGVTAHLGARLGARLRSGS